MSNDYVTVPREPTLNPMRCDHCRVTYDDRQPGSLCRICDREIAAAQPVAAEPAWFVVETPGADFDWSFFKTEAEARYATHRGDGSDPVITPLYTHAEPVAEAQPALPTQEQIMRLADEYSFSRSRLETCEPYDRRYQRQECDEARAALQAALSALPKEQP